MRFLLLFVAGSATVLLATGCGASSHRGTTTAQPSGKFPVVVTHPKIQSGGFNGDRIREVRGDRAALLSPSQLAFMTSGSVSCAWWPKRLTVLSPTSIRIDMRVNGDPSACGSGAVGFPIAVKIPPRLINLYRPLTVQRAYEVQVNGHTNRFNRTGVARPLYTR